MELGDTEFLQIAPPEQLNSNFHPSFLLFSTKMAIPAIVFCYFALQNSQIAISTPLFAIFYKNGNFDQGILPFCLQE